MANDPKSKPSRRRQARELLRKAEAEVQGRPTGEFNSGCTNVTLTHTAP